MAIVSKYQAIRFPLTLYKEINHCVINEKKTGNDKLFNFSKWVKRACRNQLMNDKNISLAHVNALNGVNQQLLGVGRNLNQIALVANRSDKVELNDELLEEIKRIIFEYQPILTDLKSDLKNSYAI